MKENMKALFENGIDLLFGGFVIASVMLVLIIAYGMLVYMGGASTWLLIPISITVTVMSYGTLKLFKMEFKSRMEENKKD